MNVVRKIAQWFHELIRGCPRATPGKWVDRDLLIIAHRGASRRRPENTLEAMKLALDLERCTALEIDLSLTADGEVVLWHDWDPDDRVAMARQTALETSVAFRPTAPGLGSPFRRPVHQLTLAELREHYGYSTKTFYATSVDAHIPTLDEFLGWATTRSELALVMFDIKIPPDHVELVPPMFTRIAELLDRHSPSFDIIRSTPCLAVLKAMKKHDPHDSYAFDAEPPNGFVLRPTRFSSASRAVRLGIGYATSVAPMIWTFAPWTTYRRIIRVDVKIRERHNRGRPAVPIRRVMAATINDETQMACLVGLGIDALITDVPDRVRAVAERLGRNVC